MSAATPARTRGARVIFFLLAGEVASARAKQSTGRALVKMAAAVDSMLANCDGRAGLANFKVRAIERADRAQWTPLWRAYLDFYRA
jgi:hypothetical protein